MLPTSERCSRRWSIRRSSSSDAGFLADGYRFFSHYVSSAQRLANGNTLITEGADARLFEIAPSGDIVWEYVSPYFTEGPGRSNRVYRAYRLPYGWVPQLARPSERAVVPSSITPQ